MFDDLRRQADDTAFEEEQDPYALVAKQPGPKPKFLGMTPSQRFVLAMMLFLMTLVISAFCLLVTEKIYIPWL